MALVTLLLPETKGKSLPATMEEAINLEEYNSFTYQFTHGNVFYKLINLSRNSKTCFCRSKKKSIDPETSIRVENQLEKY